MKGVSVIFFLFILNSFLAKAQDRPVYFVQFKITKITSLEQAQTVDAKMMNRKGILSTHTDYITSTYFCTLTAETDYGFEDFQNWFFKLGYEISCFNKGIQGTSELLSPHSLKNCEETNNP